LKCKINGHDGSNPNAALLGTFARNEEERTLVLMTLALILVALGTIAVAVGFPSMILVPGASGVGLVGLGCFFAILARMAPSPIVNKQGLSKSYRTCASR